MEVKPPLEKSESLASFVQGPKVCFVAFLL